MNRCFREGDVMLALEGELEIDMGLSDGVEGRVAFEKPKGNNTSGVGGRTFIAGAKC